MDFPTFRLLKFERSTGAKRAQIAQQLNLICRDISFLLLEDHSIAKHIIGAQWEAVTAFLRLLLAKNKKSPRPMLIIHMAG